MGTVDYCLAPRADAIGDANWGNSPVIVSRTVGGWAGEATVIDGDTLAIYGGHIRSEGINTF